MANLQPIGTIFEKEFPFDFSSTDNTIYIYRYKVVSHDECWDNYPCEPPLITTRAFVECIDVKRVPIRGWLLSPGSSKFEPIKSPPDFYRWDSEIERDEKIIEEVIQNHLWKR